MKKTILAIMLALALVAIPISSALADTSVDVTVTATPGWVSIAIEAPDPTDYDFGVVLANSTDNTGNGYFTITNYSTVDMDLDIECDGWTPTVGPGTWTYGAAGADQAQLNASSANGGVGGSTGAGDYDITVPETPGSALLCDEVGTATDPTFELELEAPSSFTHVDEQETTVTLTASAD